MKAPGTTLREDKRTAWKRQTDIEQQRMDWLVPLCIVGACGFIYLIYGIAIDGIEGAAAIGINFAIGVAVDAIIGVVAAVIAVAAFGLSFGPFWSAVLKLAACLTVAGLSNLLPLGCANLIVMIGLLLIMLNVLLDIDVEEGKWFALIFVVLALLSYIGLNMALEAVRS